MKKETTVVAPLLVMNHKKIPLNLDIKIILRRTLSKCVHLFNIDVLGNRSAFYK